MFLVRDSGNEKLGVMSATYAPIRQTCPTSCPLRDGNGCYAEGGNVGLHMRRLQAAADGINGDTIALLEAAEIRDAAPHVPAGRPLRLHVSGDASTPFRARTLADAARAWRGPVYTYTHAWRDVPRASWGGVSVLASVESIADAKRALQAGYAPAIVVRAHPSDGRARVEGGVRVIPCPSQTRGVKCAECKLCFDAPRLHRIGAAIAFATHGASRKRALRVLSESESLTIQGGGKKIHPGQGAMRSESPSIHQSVA